jgi:hypothetical protein
MQVRKGDLPSGRRWRDVLVIVLLIGLVILVGVLLWNSGPLPRVFPPIS